MGLKDVPGPLENTNKHKISACRVHVPVSKQLDATGYPTAVSLWGQLSHKQVCKEVAKKERNHLRTVQLSRDETSLNQYEVQRKGVVTGA